MPDSDGDFLDAFILWVKEQKAPKEVIDKRLPAPQFDPVQHRLNTERRLAYAALAALVGFLLLDVIFSAFGAGSRVDGPMKVAIPTLAGLAGGAFGYYFGKK